MLYLPYPFKRCSNCGGDYLPTTRHFFRRRDSVDGLRGECRTCHNAATNKWNREHPASGKARAHKHYERTKIEYNARSRKWAKDHPAAIKATNRKWYRKHADYKRAKRREWTHNNPKKSRMHGHRWRTRQRQLDWTFDAQDWQRAIDYFGGRCAVCGRPPGLWHTLAMDHWIPLSSSDCPGTIRTNILPLCHGIDGCNNSKKDRDPVAWLFDEFGPRKAKTILKRIDDYFAWVRTQDSHD